ncbi:alpha/beta fold hydrolase [Streptomyces sp. NPDC046261]|uniref:thioesterase II family protein n=1 Tax=Streptomyces sp. NPDC046261 TaxID=3157200 RepID=UPI0033F264EF
MSNHPTAGSGPARNRWLRFLSNRPGSRARLVCFPHAGGAAGYYQAWPRHIPSEVDVVAVQYPGRQDRLGDPPVTDMRTMAESVAAALQPLADRPMAFFGHSLGSAVAYETARVMEGLMGSPPAILFASARMAPHAAKLSDLSRQGDAALIAHLTELGGMAPEILADEELLGLVMPAIRADYRLLEDYRPTRLARLSTPVAALVGTDDKAVDARSAATWSDATREFLGVSEFPGGHFYPDACLERLSGEITRHLRERVL